MDDMIFNMQYPNEDKLMTTKITENIEEYIQDLAYRALSMLTLCKKVENVQLIYQNDLVTDLLAMFMKKEIQKICDGSYKENDEKGDAPPIYVLLTFRGYDMVSPFIRYNTYSGAFYSLLEKTDNVIEFDVELENGEMVQSKAQLNEDDNIWQTYKYT